ncbi:MAG TPA: SPFH domain-containing protein [Nocardioidaceae bacterium]|nr:SPFH domain-containing protein [Nocardioidaceae bacterium]
MKSTRKALFALGATVALFLLILLVARPSSISTGPDQVALHYKGGAFSSKRFDDCIAPSNRQFDGPGDLHFAYPASQTNFVFDAEDGDSGPITFVTKDGIEMTVEGVANFLLNTSCEPIEIGDNTYAGGALQRFHELIGNRYNAYMTEDGARSDGWRQMLNVYIFRPIDTATDRAGQQYTYAELYTDPNKKAQWERDVLEQLPDLVNRQTDGDTEFFQNFAITFQKPEPPQSIKDELVKQQAAVAKARAAEAEAAAREAAAEAQVAVERAEAAKIAERVKVLGRDGYLQQYAIDHGINPFQPSGGSLIVDGQRQQR